MAQGSRVDCFRTTVPCRCLVGSQIVLKVASITEKWIHSLEHVNVKANKDVARNELFWLTTSTIRVNFFPDLLGQTTSCRLF